MERTTYVYNRPVFPSWRGAPFVGFLNLTYEQQQEARGRFSPIGRRDGWEKIEWWAWAVRKDGELAKCRTIEPVGPPKVVR